MHNSEKQIFLEHCTDWTVKNCKLELIWENYIDFLLKTVVNSWFLVVDTGVGYMGQVTLTSLMVQALVQLGQSVHAVQ